MTAPVMPSAPAARAPSTGGTSDAGGAGSAAPFASALDGALSEGRAAVDDGATGDGEQQDPELPAGTVVLEGTAATEAPPLGLVTPFWALALGTSPVTVPTAGADAAVTGTGLPGVPGSTGAGTVPAGADPSVVSAPGATPAGPAVPAAGAVAPGGGVLPTPGAGPAPDVVLESARGTSAVGTPGSGPAGSTPAPAGAATAGAVPLVTEVAAAAAGVVTSAPSPDSAPAGAPAAAVTALPGVGNASSAGADTAGTDQDADGSAPGDGEAEPTAFGISGPAPSAARAATADADGATGTAASVPVAGQVARQVAVLRGAADGSHTMTLVLTPETLGPVEVSVTVTKGTVDLVLRGAHEHGRAALLDALPDLRRDLESAGLVTAKLEVSKDSGGAWLDRHAAGQQAQQGSGERPGRHGQSDGRSRPWLRTADSGETRTVPSAGSTSSGVDVRV
ncbi:flagellar hook-length control protein FliK [Blastococcus goldschmidtiae]|uniref:Flagellar hook-length control protein FliK n=1 Tax=Blastococcus goldschmidtiae TaxID=3075546 RepID=A0ABU2K622_9ACTN|nr:flagellar hook-length control protein FliK [Blastococcus sp. DSM 46792]MDT0275650.1 flagellar hook-length control protein FliK [Blastococcus sp. DSM 46792]